MSSIIWGSFTVLSVLLLTSRTNSVYGWNRNELLILTGSINIIQGIFNTVFIRNFNMFAFNIDRGRLDNFLLKPINSQWAMSMWYFNYTGIFRIIVGILVIYFIGIKMHLAFTFFNIFTYLIFGLFGTVLLYSVWFLVATFLIWNPRLSNIIDFLYTVNQSLRYPPEMYSQFKNIFIGIIIPLTLVTATPTKILLQKATMGDDINLMFVSITLLVASGLFWKFALVITQAQAARIW